MATITIQATAICSGGNHVTITASVAGGPSRSIVYTLDELRDTLDSDGAKDVVLDLIKIRNVGKTAAQAKADLQTGFTVTV